MLRSIFFFFLLLGITTNSTFSQTGFESLIQSGIEHSYDFDFDKAENLFYQAMELEPDRPEPYFYIAQMHLWFFLGTRDLGEFQIFNQNTEIALEKAEKIYNADNEKVKINFLLGLIHTNRALALSSQDEMLSAFWASKSAYGFFEDVIELNPEFYDGYYGLGLFDYALSFVPGLFRWTLTLVGLDYNKERGLNYLRKAYDKGKYVKTESAFHLSTVYVDYVAEFDSAKTILNNLVNSYPQNILFRYQNAILHIKSRELGLAEEELNEIIKLDLPQFHQTNVLSIFVKGEIYFFKNDYTKAIEYYNSFINKTKTIDYTGISNYRLAFCYSMIGNNLEAKKHLLLAKQGNQDIVDDEYASRKSEEYFSTWLNSDHKKAIIASNLNSSGNFAATINLLQDSIKIFKNEDFKAMGFCFLSEAYLERAEIQNSINTAKKVLVLNLSNENWTYSFAALILAENYSVLSNREKTLEYLEIAENNNDYDYRVKIGARINKLKRKVGIL